MYRTLKRITIIILKLEVRFYSAVINQKDAYGMANSLNPDQASP